MPPLHPWRIVTASRRNDTPWRAINLAARNILVRKEEERAAGRRGWWKEKSGETRKTTWEKKWRCAMLGWRPRSFTNEDRESRSTFGGGGGRTRIYTWHILALFAIFRETASTGGHALLGVLARWHTISRVLSESSSSLSRALRYSSSSSSSFFPFPSSSDNMNHRHYSSCLVDDYAL